MHSSRKLCNMSILSTTSVVGALNLVGTYIQNSVHNMQKCIEKGLHEMNQSVGTDIQNSFNNLQKRMEKGLHEVNQLIKQL